MLDKPTILKNTSIWEDECKRLEALMAQGKDVKAEYDRAVKNAIGERRIIDALLTLDMPMYILRDVNINYDGKSSRVNCMVFTRKMAFVIECDDIYGSIEINHDGGFERSSGGRENKNVDGVFYPMEATKAHIDLIRKIKKDEMKGMSRFFQRIMHFDNWYKTVVVITDPEATFSDIFAPKSFKQKVVRVDLLPGYIKNEYADSNEYLSDDKEMTEWSGQFLKMHKD